MGERSRLISQALPMVFAGLAEKNSAPVKKKAAGPRKDEEDGATAPAVYAELRSCDETNGERGAECTGSMPCDVIWAEASTQTGGSHLSTRVRDVCPAWTVRDAISKYSRNLN